ncbi:I78 family peptidase inhibitor [Streptomyces sp. SYSU K217416]
MAPIPTPSQDPADSPESYVGLDAAAAERLARSRGWSTVRSLPPGAIITLEYLAGRLNFEVDGGVVRRCWKG